MRGYSSCTIETVLGVKVKRCSGCEDKKPLTEFTKGSGPGGYHRHCKDCNREWRETRAPARHDGLPRARSAPTIQQHLALSPELPQWLLGEPRFPLWQLIELRAEMVA